MHPAPLHQGRVQLLRFNAVVRPRSRGALRGPFDLRWRRPGLAAGLREHGAKARGTRKDPGAFASGTGSLRISRRRGRPAGPIGKGLCVLAGFALTKDGRSTVSRARRSLNSEPALGRRARA